jgi:hypothetical protein
MPLLAQVDPGGEKYLPFAKRKLRYWHEGMLRENVRVLARVIQVSDGSRIYVNSLLLGNGIFKDRIRIVVSGGIDFLVAHLVSSTEYVLYGMRRNAADTAYEPVVVERPDSIDGPGAIKSGRPYQDLLRQGGLLVQNDFNPAPFPKFVRPTLVEAQSPISSSAIPTNPSSMLRNDVLMFDFGTYADGISYARKMLYDFSNVPTGTDVRVEYRYRQTDDRVAVPFPTPLGFGNWEATTPTAPRLETIPGDDDLYLRDVRHFRKTGVSGRGLYYDKYRVLRTVAPSGAGSTEHDASFELLESFSEENVYVEQSGGQGGTFYYENVIGEVDQLSYTVPAYTPPHAGDALNNGITVSRVFNLSIPAYRFDAPRYPADSVDVNVGSTTVTAFSGTSDFGWPYVFHPWATTVRIKDDEYFFVNTVAARETVTGASPTFSFDYPVVYTFGRLVFKNAALISSVSTTRTLTAAGTWADTTPVDIIIPYDGSRVDGSDVFVGFCVTQQFDASASCARAIYPAQFDALGTSITKYTALDYSAAFPATQGVFALPGKDRTYIARNGKIDFFVYDSAINAADRRVMAVPVGSNEAPVVTVATITTNVPGRLSFVVNP